MQQYLDIAYQFANLCKYILHSLQNDLDDFELNFIKMWNISFSLIPITTILYVSYSTYYMLTKSNLYMLEIWDNINSSSLTHVSWARKEDAWSMALKTYLFIIYWYEISLSTKQLFCGCAKLLDKSAVKMFLCYKIGRNQNLDETVFMINTWSSISNSRFITIFFNYIGKYSEFCIAVHIETEMVTLYE